MRSFVHCERVLLKRSTYLEMTRVKIYARLEPTSFRIPEHHNQMMALTEGDRMKSASNLT